MVTYLNCDDISGKSRRSAIGALDCDVFALTETHLSTNSMTIARGWFPDYEAYWGAPVDGKKGGVGFLVKAKTAWHVSPIKWPENSSCAAHYRAGRLHGVRLFLGSGSAQILITALYGISGSRWASDLKAKTHKLIEDVCADISAKGLPVLFGGDLNLQVNESPLLERLPQLGFTNLGVVTNNADKHTCFHGKQGSTIDHAFANSLMMATFSDFRVGSVADHAHLFCEFHDTCHQQMVLRDRHYGETPIGVLSKFVPAFDISLSSRFFTCLGDSDLDSAFRLWSQFAQKHLQSIWMAIDSQAQFHHAAVLSDLMYNIFGPTFVEMLLLL